MRSRSALLLALCSLHCAGLAGCGVFFGIDDPKHRVALVCGDGAIDAGEACDDGNAKAGDGCGATCAIEAGYACTGEPSVCAPICGDGLITAGEACDDANTTAGDGCDAACAIEPGYVCAGEPSECVRCGDGALDGAETCDDGNIKAGDGCGATCAIEHGYTCTGEPSVCVTTCGDGVVAATEGCDDGNTTAGDGCDSGCHTEHGFGCIEEPSICEVHCGNGEISPGEECDDGNNVAGDGCGVKCTREPGFTCDMGEPTKCLAICGDGIVVAGEACDDANFEPNDGCDASCKVEAGYVCGGPAGEPSQCVPLCGDGLIIAGEACDDGNLVSGDCCSASCQVEPGCEVEPNDTTAEAAALAGGLNPIGFTGAGKIRGAIGGVGDVDTFELTLAPAQSVVRIETFDASGLDCAAGVDTTLVLLDSLGAPKHLDDNSGIGSCSALELNLASGGYYLRVQATGNASLIPGYTLQVDVQPFAGAESESNDAMALADGFSPLDAFMTGSHLLAADVDFFKLTIPSGGSGSLRAEILEGAMKSCESGGIQSRLTLYDATATPLADDDVGQGRGLCSLLDGTGTAPLHSGAHGLPPGVYYLRVAASSVAAGASALFDYRLAVTVR
jgi:cysteine-rich repeat protein